MDEHLQPGRLGAAEDISVLLIADPGEPAALAARIAEFLPQRLRTLTRAALAGTSVGGRPVYAGSRTSPTSKRNSPRS